ncbi:type IV secretory system conjugative DNA transfer family protein [Bosea massiliensis]|uniref:Type IV secretory system conjugative DNA transfer family protein n=1 Tax=Bosea massiliensis TaxID=151419 RepID=A0ABW0NZZ2_9HYPH
MNQIRYFLAVCQHRNFTHAASASNVSQPSLTTAIKKLEHELGGDLFVRDRAGCRLTALGKLMQPRLQKAHDETQAAKAEAVRHTRLARVPISVGVGETIGHNRISAAVERLPGPDEPHQVLIVIDEFRQLGKMESLVSKLTINAGYGFRMVLILQDLAQLDELYGRATRQTTVSACQVKLFIRMNDLETSEYVSKMLGSTTIEVRTPIIRAGRGIFASRDKSVSYQERALRTAEELRQMPSDRAIVLVPNAPGFVIGKLTYFRDAPFKAIYRKFRDRRLKVPPLSISPASRCSQRRISAALSAFGSPISIASNEPRLRYSWSRMSFTTCLRIAKAPPLVVAGGSTPWKRSPSGKAAESRGCSSLTD